LRFITEEINEDYYYYYYYYYSGVATKSNYKLIEITNDYDIKYEKIRLVILLNFRGNFMTRFGNGENSFLKLSIGFNEDMNPDQNVYPFGVLVEIFSGFPPFNNLTQQV
jgi:hypothetical protein